MSFHLYSLLSILMKRVKTWMETCVSVSVCRLPSGWAAVLQCCCSWSTLPQLSHRCVGEAPGFLGSRGPMGPTAAMVPKERRETPVSYRLYVCCVHMFVLMLSQFLIWENVNQTSNYLNCSEKGEERIHNLPNQVMINKQTNINTEFYLTAVDYSSVSVQKHPCYKSEAGQEK